MKKLRRHLLVTLLLLTPGLALVAHSQDPSHSNVGTERKEEFKGEVDHMLEDLKSRDQKVYSGCLENCESSSVGGELTRGEMLNKVVPQYPPIARAAHASGTVVVKVIVDEEGKVIAAQAVSGHPLLQATSVKAARQTTFEPFLLNGQPIKIAGVIHYTFVAM